MQYYNDEARGVKAGVAWLISGVGTVDDDSGGDERPATLAEGRLGDTLCSGDEDCGIRSLKEVFGW